ncbi:Importin subunit beta-3 [Yarrowia sp. B02]|nr:Importin subunit beta-3 [Yarrowia sp. B02]
MDQLLILSNAQVEEFLLPFRYGLRDIHSDTKLATLGALTTFLTSIEKDAWAPLEPLLDDIIELYDPSSSPNKPTQMKTYKKLIALAQAAPRFFAPKFLDFATLSTEIVSTKRHPVEFRLLPLEFMTMFVTGVPHLCRASPGFIKNVISCCIQMIADGEDTKGKDREFHNSAEKEACQFLTMLARELQETVVMTLFSYLKIQETFLASTWQNRYATLMAIASISEGCPSTILKEEYEVLKAIEKALCDSSTRVQWAGCHALGRISVDLAGNVQVRYHERVVAAVTRTLRTPRADKAVLASCATALAHFCHNASKQILTLYVDDVVNTLLHLVDEKDNPLYLKQEVVFAIDRIATIAPDNFVKCYDRFTPLLVSLLKSTDYTADEKIPFLECTGTIGAAVGRDRFSPHAEELAITYSALRETGTSLKFFCALAMAWSKINPLMGHSQYLDEIERVVRPLIDSAQVVPKMVMIYNDDDIRRFTKASDWQVYMLGGKALCTSKRELEDKAFAIGTLTSMTVLLKDRMFQKDKLVEITELWIKRFEFENVQSMAAKLFPHLLEAILLDGQTTGAMYRLDRAWSLIFNCAISVMSENMSVGTLATFYREIHSTVRKLGRTSLVDRQMKELATVLVLNMSQLADRHTQHYIETGSYAPLMSADDRELLSEQKKIVLYAYAIKGSPFMSLFEEKLMAMLSDVTAPRTVIQGIRILSFLLEIFGREVALYTLITKVTSSMYSLDLGVRAEAIRCIGIAAEFGGDAYSQYTVHRLNDLFNFASSRDHEAMYCIENACATIAKIAKSGVLTKGSDLSNMAVDAFLKSLPITRVREIAPTAYVFLMDLMDSNHPAVKEGAEKMIGSIEAAFEQHVLEDEQIREVILAIPGWLYRDFQNEPKKMRHLESILSRGVQAVIRDVRNSV